MILTSDDMIRNAQALYNGINNCALKTAAEPCGKSIENSSGCKVLQILCYVASIVAPVAAGEELSSTLLS